MIKASIERLDHYNLVFQPNRYRRTRIETSDGRRYCDIPIDDRSDLTNLINAD